ncbi:MAG: hypothetical protein R3284_09605 [Rubricoccaceae bacterium]|nr:hypothetical protein [Rubricoccaceae bacterium]
MNQTKTSQDHQDDLTLITGIGDATARRLSQSLEVETFQDLAALTPDSVEAGLEGSGRRVSRKQIARWIEQARTLGSDLQDFSEQSTKKKARPAATKKGARRRRADWEPFASFVVEFQSRKGGDDETKERTSVHHLQADKDQQWAGIETERLCQWMLHRVNDELSARSPKASSEKKPLEPAASVEATPASAEIMGAERPSVSLEITGFRAIQRGSGGSSTRTGASGRASQRFVRGDEPVTFELSLQIKGPGAAEVARRHARIAANVYASNRDTATTTHLTSTEPELTEENKLSYTALIPSTVLERGTYKLECVATLAGKPPYQGHLKVPMFQVV